MPVPKFEDLEGSISNSRSQWLLQIRKELLVMLRKALTFGIVFIFALSLLAVSMITCFTYDAAADAPGTGHYHYDCREHEHPWGVKEGLHNPEGAGWCCEQYWVTQ